MVTEPFTTGALWRPLIFQAFGQADWRVVLGQIGSVGSILLISIISLLLNVSGLELTVRRDIDLNRELQAIGIANIIAGLGGIPLATRPYLYRPWDIGWEEIPGVDRSGGAVWYCADLWRFSLILFSQAGNRRLILFLGLDFMVTWVYDTWGRLPRLDYALVIAILAVISTFGFLPGVPWVTGCHHLVCHRL